VTVFGTKEEELASSPAQPSDPVGRKPLDFLPQTVELTLVGTELLAAVAAAKVGIGLFGKSLRIEEKGDLPAKEQDHRQKEQAPGIHLFHEKHGREDHGKIPVVDAAGAAALVFEQPALKWAEKENADHIADRIGTADHQHDSVVKDPVHVEQAENRIKTNPDQRDQHRPVIILDHDICLPGPPVIARELLLTSRALQPAREKPQDHLHHKDTPQDHKNSRPVLQKIRDRPAAPQPVPDIHEQNCRKEKRAVDQSNVVKHGHGRQPDASFSGFL